MRTWKNNKKFLWLALAPFAISCAPNFEVAETQMVQKINSNLGCKSFKNEVFNALYVFLDEQKTSPDAERVSEKLRARIRELSAIRPELRDSLAQEVVRLFQLLDQESVHQLDLDSADDHLQALIQLEFGNKSTPQLQSMSASVQKAFQSVETLAQKAEVPCANPEDGKNPVAEPQALSLPRAYYGGLFAFATAYQTCDSLNLLPMTASTDSVEGIKLGAKNGAGWKREYASISKIAQTHYYVRQMSYGPQCFAVNKQPLVYDYGGQPAVESSLNRINFFANSGSGGGALGIDCSAFVSSALATAGLRYSPGVSNKPIYVRQTSTNFIDPDASGWKCFKRIAVSPNQTLQSGDIMAVHGHVVMIDRVGKDPFGLKQIRTVQQCADLDVRKFDFVIMQSSPSKNSIGINRYEARDYLHEAGGKMEDGFLKYAKSACLSQFDGKTRTPAESTVGIIRHQGTSDCLDQRVALKNEACIQSCPQLKQ